MPETVGTLTLKIARLQNHLNNLDQRQSLSRPYPQLYVELGQQKVKAQSLLLFMQLYREELLTQTTQNNVAGGLFHGSSQRKQSVYPTA
jgi:hypothetical protein